MSHHHERLVCRCGAVIMQCRCMEPKVDRVAQESCDECRDKKGQWLPGQLTAPSKPSEVSARDAAEQHVDEWCEYVVEEDGCVDDDREYQIDALTALLESREKAAEQRGREDERQACLEIVDGVTTTITVQKRPTIQELEAILSGETPVSVEINPDGSLRVGPSAERIAIRAAILARGK